ncbi:SRPBCC family protein [Pelagibacterium xiamenense]|uniref:SRPBCC family protein n=1 Tax=Pelagibacterium xiamenense TaxID=2901140 RepID=UPI001E45B45B|nr:SRPBCC domain-containing protein [Pelagibacterium xiamenense]MCD7058843.1 SRPBCC domain-containing protein [Pelagibacterium xiamenense]
MTAEDAKMPDGPRLVFEARLDAPPAAVWRALTEQDLRNRWLPDTDLAQTEPVHADPGTEVRYRVHDTGDPASRNIVAFTMAPDENGGTVLRVVHAREALPLAPPRAANGNTTTMRAA